MPILIRDETANLAILTIDNSGQMTFGDGTPINMLTLAGYGIIDSNGHIVHGAGTTTVAPASGSGNCGINQTVTITTISGRIPNIQIDTNFPSGVWSYTTPDPSSGIVGGESVSFTTFGLVHSCIPTVGSFAILNNNSAPTTLTDPASPNYDGSLALAAFAYRWI
jgi:hypothetical protein